MRSQRNEGGAAAAAKAGGKAPEDKGEAQTLSHNPIQDVSPAELKAQSTSPEEVADATTIGAEKPSPKVKKYRVVSPDKHAKSNGHRALLRTGKIVSELQYNIKELRSQGIQLQEYDEAADADGPSD